MSVSVVGRRRDDNLVNSKYPSQVVFRDDAADISAKNGQAHVSSCLVSHWQTRGAVLGNETVLDSEINMLSSTALLF